MTRVLLVVAALLLGGCGYNQLQSSDEQVKGAWAEVVNQYQRRADLIPNLVNTVKGFAQQEKDVLIGVTEARAKATSVQVNANSVDDPEAFQRFVQAQREVTGALSRLLAVARQRFIKATQEFNTLARQFPTNLTAMAFGYKPKPQFSVEDEKAIAKPPTVDFGTKK